ncbi:MAG TPA: glucose 1-dehydrogenase [Acidimicrobiales bacterium]|nr:glucose 1-dehydrogenase [Acidimicrobiales bacterium]
MRLENEVAVVTGGGSGIGRETALLFAREGAKVVVGDVNDVGGKETVELVRAAGGEATFVHADVTKEPEVAGLFADAERAYGRVSVVFNNAGRMLRGRITAVTAEELTSLFTLNVVGVMLVCKHAVLALRRHGGGSIVNTASAASLIGLPNASAYCASKGAVLQVTRAVAAEVVGDGIRVNAVCPGLVDTNFYAADYAAGADPEEFRRVNGARAPMGRMGGPAEIAQAVLFLASQESSYCTGAALSVDGGITAV